VLYRHQFGNYYDDQVCELNRDYVSTEMFLARYPSDHFDSFVFGSSRSFSYDCNQFQRCLPGCRPFHYPAATENLYGIYRKVKFLDEFGVQLRNALLVVDAGALADVSSRTDHVHILHPRLSGDGWLPLELASLKAFFSGELFFSYLDYRVFGQLRPSMKSVFITPGDVRIDPRTNDFYFEREERQLRADAAAFFAERKRLFPARDGSPGRVAEPVLHETQCKYLDQLAAIFRRHKTAVRIVVSPLYDQIKLNPKDTSILARTFGSTSVFDFSGDNDITSDMHNYYDPGHYRPFVADAIMHQVWLPGDHAQSDSREKGS
jgi:hypothetical protein